MNDPACEGYDYETICNDGEDNDGDQLIDCEDPDCVNDPACNVPETETVCDDGIDNDYDDLIDCNDPDCANAPNCAGGPETDCDDNEDNDADGLTDCNDNDCYQDPVCNPQDSEAICNDEIDNDGDGYVDCADSDCTEDDWCGADPQINLGPITDTGNGFNSFFDVFFDVSIPTNEAYCWLLNVNEETNEINNNCMVYSNTNLQAAADSWTNVPVNYPPYSTLAAWEGCGWVDEITPNKWMCTVSDGRGSTGITSAWQESNGETDVKGADAEANDYNPASPGPEFTILSYFVIALFTLAIFLYVEMNKITHKKKRRK
jgi:hypothetical protein